MLTEEEKNAGLTGRIIPINIEEQMKSAYIDYSMSVIVSRALPDVRDGMKPVHRRILYDMSAELNLYSDKPTRKSAHGFQAVAHVGQRTRDDDRHRVVDIGRLHLLFDIDGDDPPHQTGILFFFC